MATRDEIEAAVSKAKELMLECGLDVDTTTDELIEWFDTDIPVPDIALDDVVLDPLLVVHELIEIDEVLKMGLKLARDVIRKNPEKVDDAHLKAATLEMKIAHGIGAAEHLADRIGDLESWCANKSLSDRRRAEYGRLLATAKDYLADLDRKFPTRAKNG